MSLNHLNETFKLLMDIFQIANCKTEIPPFYCTQDYS